MKLMASGDGDGYHEAVKEQRKEAAGRRDQHVKHNWAEAEQARYLAIKLLLEAGCRMEMASLLADAQGEVRAGGGR